MLGEINASIIMEFGLEISVFLPNAMKVATSEITNPKSEIYKIMPLLV